MFVYGKNSVRAYLESNSPVKHIYLQDNFTDKVILSMLPKVPTTTLTGIEINNLLHEKALHQGVVLEVEDYKYLSLDDLLEKIKDVNNPLLLILDGVQDPHNLGAIIRTCDSLGVNGIILPANRSVSVTPSVIKVSTGAIKYVNIARVTNLTNTIKKLKKCGYWIVGAEAFESVDYRSVDYNSPIAVVMGSEGYGISRLVLEQCDFKVKLPMVGHVNSLNVSVATAVLLYEIFNKRNPL